MPRRYIFIYTAVFTLLANCFALAYRSPWILAPCLFLLGLANMLCGLFVTKTQSIRLRILSHGIICLISFCISVIFSIALHALLLFKVIPCDTTLAVSSLIYASACTFVLFWNGILSVYLTSVQLGIRIRVLGLICGMIPVINLFALAMIIHKTYDELLFETEKERLNAARRGLHICATKYPILFVHGVLFRDRKHLNYWGRIPSELEQNGAHCFYGDHHSAAAIPDCGKELSARIREITDKTGCEKVNIIAHSKGGLDCRYAIAHCGIADRVASLTTINTPHRGSIFAEWLLKNTSKSLKKRVSFAYNCAARIFGDKKPDFLLAVRGLRADVCRKFDQETLCPDHIYTQSVGSVTRPTLTGKFPLNLSRHIVKYFDEKNDGIVGVGSFEWGKKYTLLELPTRHGISHADMIDLTRENIKGFDVREFYVGLVSELKDMGL